MTTYVKQHPRSQYFITCRDSSSLPMNHVGRFSNEALQPFTFNSKLTFVAFLPQGALLRHNPAILVSTTLVALSSKESYNNTNKKFKTVQQNKNKQNCQ